MQKKQCAILMIMVVFCSSNRIADANEKAPSEWESLKNAIERRRAAPPVHDYDVEGVIVYQPELLESSDEPITIESSRRYVLDFANGRVRCEDSDPLLKKGTEVEAALAITLFDGTDGYTLRPPTENSKGTAAQADARVRQIHALLLSAMPLFWEAGVFFPQDMLDKRVSDLFGKDFKWTSDESEATLTHKIPNAVGYEDLTYTFSKELDWRVVRYTRHVLNRGWGTVLESEDTTVVRYEMVDGVPVLAGWDLSQAPYAEKTFRVTKRAFRESAPIEEFQVPPDYLSPGMRVSKGMKPHTVTNAGTLVPWTPGQPLARAKTSWLSYVWVFAPGLLLLIWWWKRKRMSETFVR